MSERAEFGEYPAARRNRMGFSLIKTAEKTRRSPSMLNQMEHGGNIKLSHDTLLGIDMEMSAVKFASGAGVGEIHF